MDDTERAPEEPEATPTEGEPAAEAAEAEAPAGGETSEPEATPTEGEPAAEAGTEDVEAPTAEGEKSSEGE
ncbi:hypothetical protein [Streptomyces sp. NPDC058451]|uniref:hypothetical protein n=1 Tax=Streptomyces sp. NPDC058451 TaxID=3346506 RepID=UPI003663DD4D